MKKKEYNSEEDASAASIAMNNNPSEPRPLDMELHTSTPPDIPAKRGKDGKPPPMTEEELQENLAIFKQYAVYVEGGPIWVNLDFWTDEPDCDRPQWSAYCQRQLTRAFTLQGMSAKDADRLYFAFKASKDKKEVDPAHSRLTLPLHPSGFQEVCGQLWFTQRDAAPIEAVQGNPQPVLRALVRLFGLETPLILGWLRGAYVRQLAFAAEVRGRSFPEAPRASQTLAVCGPPNTGKTHVFVEGIIRGLLGKYAIMPAAWLKGDNRFNDWALTSNVFVADDSVALQSIKARRHAATILKQVGYSAQFDIECKFASEVAMRFPNERVFVTNLEEFALKALPAYEENEDKYLFIWNCGRAGFDEDYNGDYKAMNKAIADAIPAFAYYLLHDLVLPDWATRGTSRHTVADWGFMSPMVLKALSEQDEAGILMARLRRIYCDAFISDSNKFAWNSQLKIKKLMETVEHAPDCTPPVRFGKLMHTLCARYPALIDSRLANGLTEFRFFRNKLWEDVCDVDLAGKAVAKPDPKLLLDAGLSMDDLVLYPDFPPQSPPPPNPAEGFSLQ